MILASGAALFLAVIGVYGIVTYAARQRIPEFGIRLALGAAPRDLSRAVLRQGAQLALAGIGVGLVTAIPLTRLLVSLVYETRPGDPVAVAGLAALLFLVSIRASYAPARRAGRIDPVSAMRAD